MTGFLGPNKIIKWNNSDHCLLRTRLRRRRPKHPRPALCRIAAYLSISDGWPRYRWSTGRLFAAVWDAGAPGASGARDTRRAGDGGLVLQSLPVLRRTISAGCCIPPTSDDRLRRHIPGPPDRPRRRNPTVDDGQVDGRPPRRHGRRCCLWSSGSTAQ